jgi:hypothetical protein
MVLCSIVLQVSPIFILHFYSLTIVRRCGMVVCRYVLLVFMLALFYAVAWTRASGQSPPDSLVKRSEQRLGIQLGIFALPFKPPASISMSRFSAGGMLKMSAEYGKRYYGQSPLDYEWSAHVHWAGAGVNAREAAETLGLSGQFSTVIPAPNSSSWVIGSFGASIGGKVFLGSPRDDAWIFFLRGYTGLQVITRSDFFAIVIDRVTGNNRTVRIPGDSGILPLIGLTPGVEFRIGSFCLSGELGGIQLHPGTETLGHIMGFGVHYFF